MNFLTRAAARFVRRQIEARGKAIVPRVARNGPELSVLAELIKYRSLVEGKGAVVQIGANDGLMGDPVRQSILALGLPALLVEPLPDLFGQLKSNYGRTANIIFENVAVSQAAGEATIFRVNPRATDLPAWTHGLASFDKAVLLKHAHWDGVRGKNFEGQIEAVKVPVLTLGQLLARHPQLGPILALQIDTEGHDYIVIQSAIEADCLPGIIHYEHKHLSHADQVACRELLAGRGYAFFTGGEDTLAWRSASIT